MKLAFVGNCQLRQISQLLEMVFPDLTILHVRSVHMMAPSDLEETEKALANADLIMSQHISDSFMIEYVRTSKLKAIYGPKLVLLTNIYSTCTNTQVSWLIAPGISNGRIQGPLDGIHFISFINAYLSGKNPADAVVQYLEYDDYDEEVAQKSLSELYRRDKAYEIDIPFAGAVEILCRQSEALHTFHHPSVHVILQYCYTIGIACGFKMPNIIDVSLVSNQEILNDQVHVCAHPKDVMKLGGGYAPSTIFKGFNGHLVEKDDKGHRFQLDLSRPHYFSLDQLCNTFWLLYDSLDLRSATDLNLQRY